MWHEITSRLDQDPKLKLAITPGLYVHTPEKYRLRTTQWGYGEILKFVGLVRNFIIEGRILHTGETMLAEHVNRAVLVKSADNSIVISSQRSPGPIEAARCMVVAAALVSAKPASAKPSMGSSNR
jgi:hypothetical protein